MNSFESLVEKTDEGTAYRFNPTKIYYSKIKFTEEIILDLVEIFGKEFLNWKDYRGRHIGFYSAVEACIPVLLEKCGDAVVIASFINHKDNNGQHMGFHPHTKEWIPLLLEKCGDATAFINHKDRWGQHIGFYPHTKEWIPLLEKCGDPLLLSTTKTTVDRI